MPTLFYSLHFSPSLHLFAWHPHTPRPITSTSSWPQSAQSQPVSVPQLLWSSPSVKVSQVQRCVVVVLFKVEAKRKWYEEQQQKKRRVSKDSTNKLRRMCCASSSSSSSPSYVLFLFFFLFSVSFSSLCASFSRIPLNSPNDVSLSLID